RRRARPSHRDQHDDRRRARLRRPESRSGAFPRFAGRTCEAPAMTRVLVAASTAAGRPGLAARLDAHRSLHVVVGALGLSLTEQIEDAQPDVVLVHVGNERAPGMSSEGEVRATRPAVIALVDDSRGAARADWFRADGVRAVLPRRATSAEI